MDKLDSISIIKVGKNRKKKDYVFPLSYTCNKFKIVNSTNNYATTQIPVFLKMNQSMIDRNSFSNEFTIIISDTTANNTSIVMNLDSQMLAPEI